MATPGKLAHLEPSELIERIYNGEVPVRIAEQANVHKCSIYRFLADHPEYQKARKAGMAVRLDDAELGVMEADERTLARAREVWRVVTWRAEREHPESWGAANKLMGHDGGALQVQVVRFGALIDGESTQVVSSPQQKALEPPK